MKIKGRIKGTESYESITGVTFRNNERIIDPAFVELEPQEVKFIPNWDTVRVEAAIAALPKAIATCEDMICRMGSLTEPTMTLQAAKIAIDYADALVTKLKERQ